MRLGPPALFPRALQPSLMAEGSSPQKPLEAVGSQLPENSELARIEGVKHPECPISQLYYHITCGLCENLATSRKLRDHQKDAACARSVIRLLETHEEVPNVSHAIQEDRRQSSQFTVKQEQEPSAKSANPGNRGYGRQV